jgi:hypothetical protein
MYLWINRTLFNITTVGVGVYVFISSCYITLDKMCNVSFAFRRLVNIIEKKCKTIYMTHYRIYFYVNTKKNVLSSSIIIMEKRKKKVLST